MKKKKLCSYCSVPSVRYKCLLCDCTGKIEIPRNIKWHSNNISDFTIISTDHITCDTCKGKGWVLMPPIVAEKYPENVISKTRVNKL
ncbi:hypothetical protein ACFL06_01545 [Patescibacteria group bacterium]